MARKSRKNSVVSAETGSVFTLYDTAMYIRLSVDKKRGDSVENQRLILENYIATHPELRHVDTYIDNDVTGTTFERPEFSRMLADIENGKVKCVICKDLSRFGRNAIDAGYYIEKHFPLSGVRFIAVNDQFDSFDEKNRNGNIIVPLKNMINEAVGLDIGRKIRAQAHQDMKAGNFIGARAPYGYRKSPDNCHKLIVDEETAPIVQRIFELACKGMSITNIAKSLNEAGILTPSLYFQSKSKSPKNYRIGSGNWLTFTITRILTHEVYIGDMVQGKSKTVNRVQIPTAPSEWICVENTHEPIISREVFAIVGERLKKAAEKYHSYTKTPYTENIFKGLIFCGCCGKPLNKQRWVSGYHYHCISNERIASDFCTGLSIREDVVAEIVFTLLKKKAEVHLDGDFSLISGAKNVHNDKEVKAKISTLRQEIESSRKYLKSLYENLIKEVITQDEYFMMKSDYEAKITASLEEISSLEVIQKEHEVKVSQLSALSAFDGKSELNGELVRRLVDKISVYPDKKIDILLRFENVVCEVSGNG